MATVTLFLTAFTDRWSAVLTITWVPLIICWRKDFYGNAVRWRLLLSWSSQLLLLQDHWQGTVSAHLVLYLWYFTINLPLILSLTGCLTDQQVWFPVDFQKTFSRKFNRICSFVNIYRAGSLTCGITLILFTQAVAQLKDIYLGLIAAISIIPGLLQDVFTGTLK